jgi:hypothetical protein
MFADHVLLGSLVSMKSQIDHWKAFAHAALCGGSPSLGKRKRTLRKAIACEESAEVRTSWAERSVAWGHTRFSASIPHCSIRSADWFRPAAES